MRKPGKPFLLGCATGCAAAIIVPALLVLGASLLALYVPSLNAMVRARAEQKLEAPVLPSEQPMAAYDWSLKNRDEEPVPFAQFRDKVLLVHFWQPGCVTCVAELGGLKRLYDQVSDAGVVFVSVAMGDLDDLPYVLAEHAPPYEVYLQKDALPDVFEVRQTPTTIIVSADGRIVLRRDRGARWDAPEVVEYLERLALAPPLPESP